MTLKFQILIVIFTVHLYNKSNNLLSLCTFNATIKIGRLECNSVFPIVPLFVIKKGPHA